ncbi:hypothetical protein, conserved [Eimeria maxima]|uniref:Uncharacterized protein n=1 Tax=Eimeria maxima TaxID=5804 RepID=U6MAH0_EIMMA|nr:hypothetical protein, conserved [Eimeria maxima]CDJ58650.1 hypothetical protein, conserved [Eimeria maxima]
MAMQQTAATTTTTAESISTLGSKPWDFLYPPHVLGEALKQIKGCLEDSKAGAATGTIQEKKHQQMLSPQEQQQSQLLLQASPPPQPTPCRRNDEGEHSSEGERPLSELTAQQQQTQPQQQQLMQLHQVQRFQMQQLQQLTPPVPEFQRAPAHRVGLPKVSVPGWGSPMTSAAPPGATPAASATAAAATVDSPCALAFLSGLPRAYSPASQGSTAPPQTPQGELGFDAVVASSTTAPAPKDGSGKQSYSNPNQQQTLPFVQPQHNEAFLSCFDFRGWGQNQGTPATAPAAAVAAAATTPEHQIQEVPNAERQTPCNASGSCNESSCGAACAPEETSAPPNCSSAAVIVGSADPAAPTQEWQSSWADDSLSHSMCLSNSLSSSLIEPACLGDSFSTFASAAATGRSSQGSVGKSRDGTCSPSQMLQVAASTTGLGPLCVKGAEAPASEGDDRHIDLPEATVANKAATPITSVPRLCLWPPAEEQHEQRLQQHFRGQQQLDCLTERQLTAATLPQERQELQQRQQQDRISFYMELASRQKHLKQHLIPASQLQSHLLDPSGERDQELQQQQLDNLLMFGQHVQREHSTGCLQQAAVAVNQQPPHHQGCLCKREETSKHVSAATAAKRVSALLPRVPPCLPMLTPGLDRSCDRSHPTSLLITLPLNLPFGRILKFGSGEPGGAANSAAFANNSSSQSLGVKKSYYIFSPTLHPAAHTLFSHAGGICDTFAASLQMELAIIYVPCLLVPLVAAAFNTLGQQLLPQLHEPLKLRCWGLQERNAPGRFGGKVLTVSCSVEGDEERSKFEKLQTFLRHLENYVEGLLRSYGQQQQQQVDGKRLRVGEGTASASVTATATHQGRPSCCRRHKGTGQQTAIGKKNNIWRYSIVSTSRSSEQTEVSNNGGGSSSGCLDLTIRAFETRPLERPVRDFSGYAVKGICTSEIRLVTTKAIQGMTCEIDPRFRHYSIGTRPILKAPSGALCRHCIAPQLLPEVWEAHLRSGIPAARDQQKKLTETCVIAHIENRSLAKKAALLESLGRLGVPLWVNGKPLTHPAVIHPAVIAADGEAAGAPALRDMEGAEGKQEELLKTHVKHQQDQVLQQLNLLSVNTGEELQGQEQQQFKLCGTVTEHQQKHQQKHQQQQTPKAARGSRQQQRRSQVARLTQQQQAQQHQALCGQLASTSVCDVETDERLMATGAVSTNASSTSHTEGTSAGTALPTEGRRASTQQRHHPKQRLQMQQQEQLRLVSNPPPAEEKIFHLQQQQQQQETSGPGSDFLRLAEGVWMDMRPMQQQAQPHQHQLQHLHQLQQLEQLHDVQQMHQHELQQHKQRPGCLELAPPASGGGPCGKFPAASSWQPTQQQQLNIFTESTSPVGLVSGELQQQQQHNQELQPQQQQTRQQSQDPVYGDAECPLATVTPLSEINGRLSLQEQHLQQLWTPSSFTEAPVHHQGDENSFWGPGVVSNASQQQRQSHQQSAIQLHQHLQRQQLQVQQDRYQQSSQKTVGQQPGARLRVAGAACVGVGLQQSRGWEQQQQRTLVMPGSEQQMQQQVILQRQQQHQQQQNQPPLVFPPVSHGDLVAEEQQQQQQQGVLQVQRMQWLAIPN